MSGMNGRILELQNKVDDLFQDCMANPDNSAVENQYKESAQRLRDAMVEYRDELQGIIDKIGR